MKYLRSLPILFCVTFTRECACQDTSLVRRRTQEHSSIEPLDPQNCPLAPILHDHRSHAAIPAYWENIADLRHELQLDDKTFDQTSPEDMFVTFPEGGNFIFFEQQWKECDECPPPINMAAWTTNSNGVMKPHLGVYNTTSFAWKLVHPKSRNLPKFVKETIVLEGDYAVFIPGWYCIYQHVLVDHLGYLAYMKQVLPPTTKIIMPQLGDDFMLKNMLMEIDPPLALRIHFLKCQEWHTCYNQLVEVKNGSLQVLTPRYSSRHPRLFEMVRSWLWHSARLRRSAFSKTSGERTVIYYKRTTDGGATNGRCMDEEQETQILARIQHALERYGRSERLVVFEGGMSLVEQVQLFSSASVVIGPHGGGLANLMYLPPGDSCHERPKVLEFVTNPETPEVQGGDLRATYYTFFSTCSWAEFHQMLFTPPSNGDTTFIDMASFDEALKSLFSRSNQPSNLRSEQKSPVF